MLRSGLSLLVLFLLSPYIIAQNYMPEFEADECPYFMGRLAGENDTVISCGFLIVPENREKIGDSFDLELFVVWIESKNLTDNIPIVILEGGPGGAASAGFEDWLKSSLHTDYDIILVDQRGTGLSYPSLNCPELDEVYDIDAIETCRNRLLDDRIQLDTYNSANNAHDIHDLLVALDIDEANLYGSSYGSRLSLTMARDFPERIHAMILDAVYPPHVNTLEDEAYYGHQAFERLFADCATDEQCNSAYPNLRDSFYDTIIAMNNSPAYIEDFELGFAIEMTGDDFVNNIYGQLYETEMIPLLPALIDAYSQGENQYNPQVEVEQLELEENLINKTLEPDKFDILAMEFLGIDDVIEFYTYLFTLEDTDYDRIMTEIETYAYYAPFRDYLEFDTIDETADYVDLLDDDDYFELEADVHGFYDDDSEGMFFSVECYEEIHFNSEDDIEGRSQDVPEQIALALLDTSFASIDECDTWTDSVSDDSENQPVESDIPTLILSGAYDPTTPPEWGTVASEYLPNSWHYIFPNVGHSALEVNTCATSIVLDFLHNTAQKPDDSCMPTQNPPQFFIRE